MKKLLSILGAVMLSSATASSVVACSNNMYTSSLDNPSYKKVDHTYDEATIKASLIARSKSLVVDDMFGFDDSISKNYALENNKIGNLVAGIQNANVAKTTIGDKYASFIDDSDLSDATFTNKNKGISGNIGEEGGVLPASIDAIINALTKNMDSTVAGVVKTAINKLLDSFGLNGSGASIAEALKPILQAMGKLNTKVAMQGIPFALGLIPKFPGGIKALLSIISPLVPALTGAVQETVDNGIQSLIDAADLTKDADKTLPDIQTEITTIVKRMITQDGYTAADGEDTPKYSLFTDMIRFANLTGDYMSFFKHDDSSALDTLSNSANSKLSDSAFYKIDDGKGFNLAPLLNEANYYLGAGVSKDRILKLCQILFLKSDSGKFALNDIGQYLVSDNGPLLTAINSLLENNNGSDLTSDEATSLLTYTLVNDDSKQAPDDNAKALFDGKKPFDVIYDSWKDLGKLKDVEVGEALLKDTILARVFVDDVNGNTESEYSLRTLLKAPLYKLLMLDSTVKKAAEDKANSELPDDQKANAKHTDFNPGFGIEDLIKNFGILPNFAGYYTQKSILELASELNGMFSLNNGTLTDEQLQYHYFDFTDMKTLVDDLLFDNADSITGTKGSLLKFLVDNLAKDNAQEILNNEIGYDNNGDVKVNSWMGKLLNTLVPELKLKKDATIYEDEDLTPQIINESDDLQFLIGGLTRFVGNITKATDYTYWLEKVFDSNYDGGHMLPDGTKIDNDPDGNSVWYYEDYKSNIWDQHGNYGFTTDYFADGKDVRDMTLNIKFNMSNLPSIINRIKLTSDDVKSWVYTVKISRNDINSKLAITSISRSRV